MKLDFNNERVLAVVAHPDDAELLCAGTLARARHDGATVGVCVLCRGDKGQPHPPVKNLVAVRRREMEAAARHLNAELYTGNASDGELRDDPSNRQVVVEFLRQFHPTLVLAHSPDDYHPDHRAASQLAEAASWFCASRGHRSQSEPIPEAPALWWMDTINGTNFEPAFYIDVSEYLPLKEEMLACHTSQVQRADDRDFAPLPELMRKQAQFRGSQAGVAAAEAFRLHAAFKRLRAW